MERDSCIHRNDVTNQPLTSIAISAISDPCDEELKIKKYALAVAMKINELTEKIIGCAIQVRQNLGPGFFETVYQAALAYELRKAGIAYEKEKTLPVPYEDIVLDAGFRCDFLVDKRVIVECKSVQELHPIDQAKVLNYLKIAKLQVGAIP